MKRTITCLPLVVMTTVIISACGQTGPSVVGSTAEAQQTDISDAKSSTTENNDKDIKVWNHSEMPVSLEYDRMWEYSSSADTKDPELISDIVGAIKQLSVGDETEIMTTDLTDVLNFEFEDGTSVRLEFEGDCLVTEENKRYQVDGLDRLRSILEKLMNDETSSISDTEESTDKESKYKDTADLHVDNGLFSIDIPKEFEGTYTAYYNSTSIYLEDNVSVELLDGGGFVFEIKALDDPDDYEEDHYTVLGQLESGDGQDYEVIIEFPTDLQFAPANRDNYDKLTDKAYEIAATIKSTDGGTFTPRQTSDTQTGDAGTEGSMNIVHKLYKDTVEKHIKAIKEGWNRSRLEEEEMSYLYELVSQNSKEDALEKIGYIQYDSNDDGSDELYFGEVSDEDSMIYDMYSLVELDVWHIFSSGEKEKYYLTRNNLICREISDGADVTEWTFYKLQFQSNLKYFYGGLKYDPDKDKSNPWFKANYGKKNIWNKVSEKDWKSTMNTYGTHQKLIYTPLSEYK